MSRRTTLFVLTIVFALGALFVKGPGIGWYRYQIHGAFSEPVTFYSPVAIPMRHISGVICKVKPPRLGEGFGISQYDCLQGLKRRRPKGWNSDE